jgi:hypothetical protein
MIHICGPHDKPPKEALVINTTSRSRDRWSRSLSPFHLGPVKLYQNHVAYNMENGWQFAKVYQEFVDPDSNPTDEYWKWSKRGWLTDQAVRYPMGRDQKPLYHLWDGVRMDYITARSEIYIPLYTRSVIKTGAWQRLVELHQTGKDFYLWDFDGYDHRAQGMNLYQVLMCETRKMGHAFVLAMMLEESVTSQSDLESWHERRAARRKTLQDR